MSKFSENKIEDIHASIEDMLTSMIQYSKYANDNEKQFNTAFKQERTKNEDSVRKQPNKRYIDIPDDDEWEDEFTTEALARNAHRYTVSEIQSMLQEQLFRSVTNLEEYDTFSKEAVQEHYDYYVKTITSLFDEKGNPSVTPDKSFDTVKRGTLENELLRDICSLSKKEKRKLHDFVLSQKKVLKEASYGLKPNKIENYLHEFATRTFGTVFTVDDDHLTNRIAVQTLNNSITPLMQNEINVVHTTLTVDSIKTFARQLQAMRETLSARPWYSKLSSSYRASKRVIVLAEQSLINKGVDAKDLDKYVNSKGAKAETLLNQLMTKSAEAIETFLSSNKENLSYFKIHTESVYTEESAKLAEPTLEKVNALDFDKIKVDENEFDLEDTGEELTDSAALREEKTGSQRIFHETEDELASPIEFKEEFDEEEEDLTAFNTDKEDVKEEEPVLKD